MIGVVVVGALLGGASFEAGSVLASAQWWAQLNGTAGIVLAAGILLFAANLLLAWRSPWLGLVAGATVLVLVVIQLATSWYAGPATSFGNQIDVWSYGGRSPLLMGVVATLVGVSVLRLRVERTHR